MKTKLLRKLRKQARSQVEIKQSCIHGQESHRNPELSFHVYYDGRYLNWGDPISGNWCDGYESTHLGSVEWYCNRLVSRIVECKAHQLRAEKNKRLNKEIKL